MEITVRTRSTNDQLFKKMRAFIPSHVECVAHTAYDDWTDALRFLTDVIVKQDEVLVVCDEDCFISDWRSVELIAEQMLISGALAAGMPDGGVSTHRCHSWVVLNPFFLVLNAKEIYKILSHESMYSLREAQYQSCFESRKPHFILGGYDHNNTEPFAGLFYFLFKKGNFLFLEGATMGDGMSTELKGLDGRPFAYHSWMSREYNNSDKERTRIDNLFYFALSKKA